MRSGDVSAWRVTARLGDEKDIRMTLGAGITRTTCAAWTWAWLNRDRRRDRVYSEGGL